MHVFPEPPLYQTSFDVGGITLIDEEDAMLGLGSALSDFIRWAPQDSCKFCSSALEILEARGVHGDDADGSWTDAQQFVLGCLNCGWWRYEFASGGDLMHYRDVAIGSILRVDDRPFWAPVPVIRDFLNKHPRYLRESADPILLEQVLRDVFSDYFDVEVRWTGRGADGGFDLYHVLGSATTLYQIKRRGPRAGPESVVPLRALLGTMVVHGAVRGIYVTTADRFSHPAKREAERAGERGYKLELVTYDRLVDILRSTAPKNLRPYEALWNKHSAHYERLAARVPDPSQGFFLIQFPPQHRDTE